jgi:hypothetical protein
VIVAEYYGKSGEKCNDTLALRFRNSDPTKDIQISTELNLTHSADTKTIHTQIPISDLQSRSKGWLNGDHIRVVMRLDDRTLSQGTPITTMFSFDHSQARPAHEIQFGPINRDSLHPA